MRSLVGPSAGGHSAKRTRRAEAQGRQNYETKPMQALVRERQGSGVRTQRIGVCDGAATIVSRIFVTAPLSRSGEAPMQPWAKQNHSREIPRL